MLDALTEAVLGYGVKVLLVKLGHRGIYLRTGESGVWRRGGRGLEDVDPAWHDRALWAPAFEAGTGAVTGAGDAANAGFLAGPLGGAAPETALRVAAAAGAVSDELPAWDELLARIKGDWNTLPLDLSEQGWRKDKVNDIWQKD
jgi:sugar/nucleoside kinase (ribokinase family)